MHNNINPFEEHGLSGLDAELSVDLSLASDKAWVKMGNSAFANRYDWILSLIEAAILIKAKIVNVRLSHKWDNVRDKYDGTIKMFDSSKAYVSMISIKFNSNHFPDLISRLPFYLVSEGESELEKILHNIAMGMAGSIGFGAKLLDFSFYTGNNKGQRIILDANKKDVTLVYQKEEEMLESSWLVCLDANDTDNKITGAFNHCYKRTSLITERPLLNLMQAINIFPKAPPNYSNFFKETVSNYYDKTLFSVTFNDYPFVGHGAIMKDEVKSALYLTRNYLHIATVNNINLPWNVPTIMTVDHPDFKTDLSRNMPDQQCKAYKDMINKLYAWQETALLKHFTSCFDKEFIGYSFNESRILFYRFLQHNAEKIKTGFSAFASLSQDKINETFIKLLLTKKVFQVLSSKALKKLSLLQKIQFLPVEYEKFSLLDLYDCSKNSDIFVCSNRTGFFTWEELSNKNYLSVIDNLECYRSLAYALTSLFPKKVYLMQYNMLIAQSNIRSLK